MRLHLVLGKSFFILALLFPGCRLFEKKASVVSPSAERHISSSTGCHPAHLSLQQENAVIVMYHRFDGKYSSTSVTKDLLEQHIQYFQSNGFKIVPLSHVVDVIFNGPGTFPTKTLAITVDDAYRSAYETAHPLFVKNKIPYTVFVNTEGIDKGIKAYMSWDQLREIGKSPLVTLEAHGHAHANMVRNMNPAQREKDVRTSVQRLYKETGKLPKYFAYPYGETNYDFMRELKNYRWNIGGRSFSFQAAFTTQSGPAGCSSNRFALPRFALNMTYGKLTQAFYNKMNSRHFPVQTFKPDNPAFCSSTGHTEFFLKVSPEIVPHLKSLKGRLNCFSSRDLTVQTQNSQAHIILSEPFTNTTGEDVRERINCTLQAKDGRYYWMGQEFSILSC